METNMTKKQALTLAVNFLSRCFSGDIDALTAIVCADADIKHGDDDGIDVIVNALDETSEFVQELLCAIRSK